MASITIRQLPEEIKRKLKIRAAEHSRSMEQEAREILKGALQRPKREQPKDLTEAIRHRFGGVELEIPLVFEGNAAADVTMEEFRPPASQRSGGE